MDACPHPPPNFEQRFRKPQEVSQAGSASTLQLARRALRALTRFRYSLTTSDLHLLLQAILLKDPHQNLHLPCLGLINDQGPGTTSRISWFLFSPPLQRWVSSVPQVSPPLQVQPYRSLASRWREENGGGE